MAQEKYDPSDAARDVLLVLGGALIGAAVALLYAPQSGDRTRKQIARKYEDAKDQAREYSEEILERVDDIKKTVTKQVEAAASAAGDAVGEKKEVLLGNIASLQDKLGSLKKKIAKR